jgi:ribosomal protein S18 acetylase RimI-like enzyme
MKTVDFAVRAMTMEDYEAVHDLWMTIHGFGIRSVDDSKEGVERFLQRNPGISVVAEVGSEIVGAILCGHDGRRGCFYHVCVREDMRRQGIGKAMATAAMRKLQEENISKVNLVAFKRNEVGNQFWHEEGWQLREDLNTYDFLLNEENITNFNS